MSEAVIILKKLKGVFPNNSKTRVTNFVFRLHSHVTFTFLLIFSVLVFVQQLLDQHMKCLIPGSEEDLRSSAVTTYCFITGTYTILNFNSKGLNSHPGVGNHIEGETTQKFHHYFQWVPFVLFIQCMLFRVPYFLWRLWEGQKLDSCLSKTKDSTSNSVTSTAQCFTRNMGYNKLYAISYIFSELLNFLLVLVTFWTTDWFLQGQFRNLGWDYFRYWRGTGDAVEKQINPLDQIFPKVSKCLFKKFGPSGEVVNYDILCILAQNIINEKIFLGLWAWLIILFIFGSIVFVFRSILITFPTARAKLILRRTGIEKDRLKVKYVLFRMGYADWFFLKRISDNLDTAAFVKFCDDVKVASRTLKMKHDGQAGNGELNINGSDEERRRNPIHDTFSSNEHRKRSLYDLQAIEEESNLLMRTNHASLTRIPDIENQSNEAN